MKGNVKVFACGGAAANIIGALGNTKTEDGMADLEIAFFDTSISNLRKFGKSINTDQVYMIEGLDGSGKVRKENIEPIRAAIKPMLLNHRPADVNVVVFSASGGSGSVIGPLVLRELLERGETVVALVVGSDESIITADNCLNTMKSLEGVARSVARPVVMYYTQNHLGSSLHTTDVEVRLVLTYLTILASGQNDGIDSRDVAHFVDFSKTTAVQPQVALLQVFKRAEEVESVNDPVAITSIYASRDELTTTVVPDYISSGYADHLPDGLRQLHFVITPSPTAKIVSQMVDKIGALKEVRNARNTLRSLINDADVVGDDGMVL